MTKRPLYSEDAEHAVLGAVLLRPKALERLSLQADDFYDPRHRAVYQAMCRLEGRELPIDPLTVFDELARMGVGPGAVGLAFVSDLSSGAVTADNIEHHAEIVREHARVRAVLLEASRLAGAAEAGHGTAAELAAAARARLAPFVEAGTASSSFVSAADRLAGEADRRCALVSRRISFGVSYLDHALGGILPNDLILVGAYTGTGKTQVVTIVARGAVRAGRRVAIFALEAEPDELERRIKYGELVDTWYRQAGRDRGGAERLSYRAWYEGGVDDLLGDVEHDVTQRLAAELRGLSTLYRGASFGLDDLDREIRALGNTADLVVIDHLHYVDIDDESENRGYRNVVKRVRDLSLAAGVPVILVVHLRKRDRGTRTPVPELDDIHGTSDVAKIATKAIFLARAPRPEGASSAPPYLWGTYIATPKDRAGVESSRYVALCAYNARTGSYEDGYQLGHVIGDKWTPLAAAEVPRWAVGARQPEARPTRAGTHAARTADDGGGDR